MGSNYFMTGATGFIGRRLLAKLLERPQTTRIYALVRSTSRDRLIEQVDGLPGAERVVPVIGDLAEPALGVDATTIESMTEVDHVIHLAAVYDFTVGEKANQLANVAGTRHLIELAGKLGTPRLHHVSSIAVAGQHGGRFTEQDFDLGQRFASPYHATKFEAERLVRAQTGVPFTVYRPSVVVGDSRNGRMDKVDGPYYLLPTISRMAALPGWLPLPSIELGSTNLVPVNFVVDAIARLMHLDAESGATYHLAAPRMQSLNEVYDAFADAAGAPRITAVAPEQPSRLLRAAGGALGKLVTAGLDRIPGGRAAGDAVLTELGVPSQVLAHLSMAVEFDTTATDEILADAGIEMPELTDYAGRLYRYWAGHLDPDRARRGDADAPLRGRIVLITGASSGIGRAAARMAAREGATVLLVARRADVLDELREQIEAAGGSATTYPCDLSDSDAIDALVKAVLADHGRVDMLVNNAGRSIRRSAHLSTERFHDFERQMAVNYFGAVRLTLGLLTSMRQRGFGHIVNVTSQGLEIDTPRFSGYLSSKAALEEFGLAAGKETLSDGVTFTSVRLPLVRTEMIQQAKATYRGVPSISADQAAKLVMKALVQRPIILSVGPGRALEVASRLTPRLTRAGANLSYELTAESAPEARSKPGPALAVVAGSIARAVWRRLA